MKKEPIVKRNTCDLQKLFTAYLLKAVRRRKSEYIRQLVQRQQIEVMENEALPNDLPGKEEGPMESSPIWFQLENAALLSALNMLNEREQHIIFSRVLEQKSFEIIARQYEMNYKAAAIAYYRAVDKIRKKIGEKSN